MTDWTETYRGGVPPWQCDVTEHFTVGYYFDRLEEADANLAEDLGLGDRSLGDRGSRDRGSRDRGPSDRGVSDTPRRGDLVRRIDLRFVRELRAGASFHVESAPLGLDGHGLRVGHRFVDSANGEVVTWIDAHWDLSTEPLTEERRRGIEARIAVWNGPAPEPRPEPTGAGGFIPTARGRVKPGDLDAAGNFALGPIVLRFSNASGQVGAALGMDVRYMQENRRGFSTFELTMRIRGALAVDAPYLIETGIAHLGNSSMRMVHRMTDPRTGAEVARLGQFGVNLDLDARRPARWPEDVRGRAAALVVPVG